MLIWAGNQPTAHFGLREEIALLSPSNPFIKKKEEA